MSCSENDGDCDGDDECQAGLACGSDNCPVSLGFGSEVDCCYQPSLNEDFGNCTTANPCGVGEGDCDLHNECQAGLFCDTANDCSSNFGLNYLVECCQIGMSIPFIIELINVLIAGSHILVVHPLIL